ncbi:MAG: CoA transferase [Peptococcaceae bacterium]|jgi:crotonobetainyl-CoA:carnitine CoA-transferase CaiB-like acyl-CoA transferase|nr:CoA transferase [Peptococcaceae bacterium]
MYPFIQEMRILDLTRLFPGGYATQLLGDLGARVLKVEDPWRGDYLRWEEPCFPGTNESVLFWGLNRNKKSIKLNLKSAAGKRILFKLLEQYDIVLEGFRPGVMDKLGIGYEQLKAVNPAVILCSISGFGQDGPCYLTPGHDINYMAIAGALGLSGTAGGAPVTPAVQVADIGGGGMMAVIAVLAAYIHRQTTGKGQYIDISMLDGVVSWMSMLFLQAEVPSAGLKRGETRLGGGEICYNVYQTKDGGYMALGALEPQFWLKFCQLAGREDWITEQFSRNGAVKAEVEILFKTRTRDEWAACFAGADVCCEPVLDLSEVKAHPQVSGRKLFKRLDYDPAGVTEVVRNPIRFPTEPELEDLRPPGFGEHSQEVLRELGLSEEEILILLHEQTVV